VYTNGVEPGNAGDAAAIWVKFGQIRTKFEQIWVKLCKFGKRWVKFD